MFSDSRIVIPGYPEANFFDPTLTVSTERWRELFEPTLIVGAIGATFLTAHIALGNLLGINNTPPEPPAPDPMEYVVLAVQEADFYARSQEVHAVAHRYDSCSVAGPVDTTHNFMAQPGRAVRDRVIFTIDTQRNAAGRAAETEYQDNDTIMWDSGVKAHFFEPDKAPLQRGREILSAAPDGPFSSSVEEDHNIAELYPKADYPEGTQIVVSALVVVDRSDFYLERVHRESVLTSCGLLRMTRQMDGQLDWEPVAAPPSLPNWNRVETNMLVDSPDNPNSYHEEPIYPAQLLNPQP